MMDTQEILKKMELENTHWDLPNLKNNYKKAESKDNYDSV